MPVDDLAMSSSLQSRMITLLTAVCAVGVVVAQLRQPTDLRLILEGAAFSLVLALLVLLARAATSGAAALGSFIAFSYALTSGGAHSTLWLLTATLALTLGASRVGRKRKQAQGTGEGKHGRTASQVAANLGAGVIAWALLHRANLTVAQTAMTAALAETAADTLASELGQLAQAPPRMLLTGKPADPGTDGAVSVPGTLAGVAGAALVVLTARWCFALPWAAVLVAFVSGVFGLFFDSLLGQLLERRGVLHNDAVNFLSTLAAALAAIVARGWI